jgi:hypothetical protein
VLVLGIAAVLIVLIAASKLATKLRSVYQHILQVIASFDTNFHLLQDAGSFGVADPSFAGEY